MQKEEHAEEEGEEAEQDGTDRVSTPNIVA